MVTRLNNCVLEIDARLDGAQRTGIFELAKNYNCTGDINKSFAVNPADEVLNRALNFPSDGSPDDIRQPYIIDAGGGKVPYKIRATLSETTHNGEYLQMGNTGDETTLTALDATGAGPRTQADVLSRYIEQATTDSLNPATLHLGHYHDGTYTTDGEPGLFGEPRAVYIPNGPHVVEAADEASSVEISLTCVPVGSLEPAGALTEQEEF
ncbi:hypothetical protein C499_00865 [Halogeometricum borinquense DSM 11551]|uniref:Uncharacterized protein n=1 Tax=Halogeometricum borinquense (strain ATCC 700274 / DSM 11551 / JCM 10706 / KCTC 4070 / PR3) TaxID=469382 RepID=E4NW35_HALBP|nr:hypothetical protein [Halogeometricum borinquense]ADQ69255.1 hypothetical protein Hbor_39410 [Halogeometricum borinquense DSM 11551]ELY31553.1 hypothetical protein C499_00865 [Halogeometricum borinquense DSM 11551]